MWVFLSRIDSMLVHGPQSCTLASKPLFALRKRVFLIVEEWRHRTAAGKTHSTLMVISLYTQFRLHLFFKGLLEFEKKKSAILFTDPQKRAARGVDVSICNKIKSVTKKPRGNNKNAILSRQKRNSKNKAMLLHPVMWEGGPLQTRTTRRTQHRRRVDK